MNFTSDYSIIATSSRDQSKAILKLAKDTFQNILTTKLSRKDWGWGIDVVNWEKDGSILLKGKWIFSGSWSDYYLEIEEADDELGNPPSDEYICSEIEGQITRELRRLSPPQFSIINIMLGRLYFWLNIKFTGA